MRVETNTWNITTDELSYENQCKIICNIYNIISINEIKLNKLERFFSTHIKSKMSSYKQQDLLKKNNIIYYIKLI